LVLAHRDIPFVCLAAHESKCRDGFPDTSNYDALPGIAGGLPLGFNKYGYYVTLVCKKLPGADLRVDMVRREISEAHVHYDVIDHGPVFSAKEARSDIIATKEIDEIGTLFLKSVVFHVGNQKARNKPIDERDFVLVALPWDMRVNESDLAGYIDVSRNKIERADREALFQLGFPLGGVSPFGIRHPRMRRILLDVDFQSWERVVFGSGSHLHSLCIPATSADHLFQTFERI
ncbi:Aminoacyl-tRNA editing domain-containing protein, partial [Novosphingobium sp. CF614]|uniref:aminoacyl-tRNA deacylase n=1 Tax=Novosphingobium sp. CF614 TaxID=1884364 RepID=UPI0008E0636C